MSLLIGSLVTTQAGHWLTINWVFRAQLSDQAVIYLLFVETVQVIVDSLNFFSKVIKALIGDLAYQWFVDQLIEDLVSLIDIVDLAEWQTADRSIDTH